MKGLEDITQNPLLPNFLDNISGVVNLFIKTMRNHSDVLANTYGTNRSEITRMMTLFSGCVADIIVNRAVRELGIDDTQALQILDKVEKSYRVNLLGAYILTKK